MEPHQLLALLQQNQDNPDLPLMVKIAKLCKGDKVLAKVVYRAICAAREEQQQQEQQQPVSLLLRQQQPERAVPETQQQQQQQQQQTILHQDETLQELYKLLVLHHGSTRHAPSQNHSVSVSIAVNHGVNCDYQQAGQPAGGSTATAAISGAPVSSFWKTSQLRSPTTETPTVDVAALAAALFYKQQRQEATQNQQEARSQNMSDLQPQRDDSKKPAATIRFGANLVDRASPTWEVEAARVPQQQQQREQLASPSSTAASSSLSATTPKTGTTAATSSSTNNNQHETGQDQPPKKKRIIRRGRMGCFPQKMHQVLETLERTGREDVASFVMDGVAFQIHKPHEFAEIVQQYKFFKMTSYSSFQRQLNLYSFTRILEGPFKGAYQHPRFVKGKPLWTTTMKRNVNLGQDAEEQPGSVASSG